MTNETGEMSAETVEAYAGLQDEPVQPSETLAQRTLREAKERLEQIANELVITAETAAKAKARKAELELEKAELDRLVSAMSPRAPRQRKPKEGDGAPKPKAAEKKGGKGGKPAEPAPAVA